MERYYRLNTFQSLRHVEAFQKQRPRDTETNNSLFKESSLRFKE